jgi:hypothetical protein
LISRLDNIMVVLEVHKSEQGRKGPIELKDFTRRSEQITWWLHTGWRVCTEVVDKREEHQDKSLWCQDHIS